MRIVSSLTLVKVDSLLASIDDALHNMAVKNYTTSVEKSHNILSALELRRFDAYVGSPLGVLSPFYQTLESAYKADFLELVLDRPVRRFIFDGTPIHFGFYVKPYDEWLRIVIEYIGKKVKGTQVPLTISDPFAAMADRVVNPFQSSLKTYNFFEDVRRIEREKAVIRPWFSRGS